MKEEQERVETRTHTSFPIFIGYSYDWQAVLDGLRENPEIKDGRDINWIKLGVRRTFPPSLPPSLLRVLNISSYSYLRSLPSFPLGNGCRLL